MPRRSHTNTTIQNRTDRVTNHPDPRQPLPARQATSGLCDWPTLTKPTRATPLTKHPSRGDGTNLAVTFRHDNPARGMPSRQARPLHSARLPQSSHSSPTRRTMPNPFRSRHATCRPKSSPSHPTRRLQSSSCRVTPLRVDEPSRPETGPSGATLPSGLHLISTTTHAQPV